jgi:hypothetical protein
MLNGTKFGVNLYGQSYVQFAFANGYTTSIVDEGGDRFNCSAWPSGVTATDAMKWPSSKPVDGVAAAAWVARVARWKAPL